MLVELSLLLITVIGVLSVWFPAAVKGDANVLLPLNSSVVGDKGGTPPGPAIIGVGCRNDAEEI